MKRLKELRLTKKMSQQILADLIGVSRSTVAMWETSSSQPDNDCLLKLSDIFEVSTDYLLGRTDDPSQKTLDEQLEGVEFSIWGEVHDLTDGEKQDVIKFIKFLKFTKSKREEK